MHKLKGLIPQQLKNLYHLAQAMLANIMYGFPARRSYALSVAGGPSRKIKVIGITGSDGKTTTVQMVVKILEEAGKKVAMASTINFSINGKEEKNLSHYTTESAFSVQKFIARAVKADCEYLILETSSHALDQHRTWGVQYQTALITNVTREHLDYHKTMQKYREAKEKLFEIVSKNKGTVIVNLDMEKPEDFLKYGKENIYGYTMNCHQSSVISHQFNSDVKIVKAEKIEFGINYSKFEIFAPSLSLGQNSEFLLNIPGDFNIENALGASCVALSEGVPLETIKEALAKIKGIPGRLESIENDRGAHIIVDFALTPNALERLYKLLTSVKKAEAKIIAVFGSCGERDRGKRPIMGEVVSKYADFIVVTNDEPYHEDPAQIIDEISDGIKNKIENGNFWKIADRRLAIRKALELAKTDDIVVVTGMGNFETMVVGDEKIPWNDRKVIEEELKNLS